MFEYDTPDIRRFRRMYDASDRSPERITTRVQPVR